MFEILPVHSRDENYGSGAKIKTNECEMSITLLILQWVLLKYSMKYCGSLNHGIYEY